MNSALQATRIAKSFWPTSVCPIPCLPPTPGTYASDLVYQFSANPYAYEFALILTRYGALGDKDNNNHSDTIDNIGLKIIDLLGGHLKSSRIKIILKDILEKSASLVKASMDSFSTANFWALDPQICPKRMRKTLICKSIVWLAFGFQYKHHCKRGARPIHPCRIRHDASLCNCCG